MKNISFIGIGLMGFPMAKNLLKSNYNLKAYNRSQDKAARLKEFGAEISTSIKEVVTNSDVVITMLTDDAAVEKVMGNDEFISNIKESATVIDMSSVNPVITKKYVIGKEYEGVFLKPKYGDASGVRGAARLGRKSSY